jgi:alcohol dehydrogenase class IV
VVDLYAIEGVRLAALHLLDAIARPDDIEARESMALAGFYGGLCLGPVNTAAVHAFAYPLAGEFKLPHGLAVATVTGGIRIQYSSVSRAARRDCTCSRRPKDWFKRGHCIPWRKTSS